MKSTSHSSPVVRIRPSAAPAASTSSPTPSTKSVQPRRRRWRWLLWCVPVLGVLTAAAPRIIAGTPLFGWLLARVATAAELNGTLRADSATLGWLSPVRISGLELADAEGETAAKAVELRTERTLLGLVFQRANLGALHVEGLEIDVDLRRDGSNWENILAEILASTEPPSPLNVSLNLTVTDGTIRLHDRARDKTWTLDDVAVEATLPQAGAAGLSAKISASYTEKSGARKLAANLVLPGQTAAAGEKYHHGSASLQFDRMPLQIVQGLLDRVSPGIELHGWLNTQLECEWNRDSAGPRSFSLAGTVGGDKLSIAAPALGEDRLRLAKAALPCNVAWEDGLLTIARLELSSDVGKISCEGTTPLAASAWSDFLPDAGALTAALAGATGRVDGELDIARLASLLPNTLRLRETARITGGTVTLAASSGAAAAAESSSQQPAGRRGNRPTDAKPAAAPGGRAWELQLTAGELSFVVDGQELSWPKPLFVSLRATEQGGKPQLDYLVCKSDFLEIDAVGSLDDLELTVAHNLDRLSQELGRFADLGGLRMAGDGQATLRWRRKGANGFTLTGSASTRNFELSIPGHTPWLEARLDIEASARGGLQENKPTRLDAANLEITAAGDNLTVSLTKPVASLGADAVWPFKLDLTGDLERWRARLEPVLGALPGWDVRGDALLSLSGQYASSAVDVDSLDLRVDRLLLAGPGLTIDEMAFHGAGAGQWNAAARSLSVSRATVDSAAIAASTENFAVALPADAPPAAQGRVRFDGDVHKLAAWLRDPRDDQGLELAGQYNGALDVEQSAERLTINLTASVKSFSAASRDGRSWNEPSISLAARMDYDRAADAARLEKLDIRSRALKLDARGELAEVSGTRLVDLQGQYTCDLAQVQPFLQELLGPGIALTGKQKRSFSVSGPLAGDLSSGEGLAAQLEGAADAGWQSANLYGFSIGPGDLKARLAGGLLTLDPLDLEVNRGRLWLAPALRLSPGPMELTLERGKIVDNVDITPETCQQALMYINPALAHLQQVEGRCSLSLDGCRLPLADLAAGELQGELTVHAITIDSPSPLIAVLAAVAGQQLPVEIERESRIGFHMADRRVYHDRVEIVFPRGTIRTRGSVGLDQTLDIVAEIPLSLLPFREQMRKDLADEIVEAPITGTLKQVRLDDKKIRERLARMAEEGAARAVEGGVNRLLDQLLKKKEKK